MSGDCILAMAFDRERISFFLSFRFVLRLWIPQTSEQLQLESSIQRNEKVAEAIILPCNIIITNERKSKSIESKFVQFVYRFVSVAYKSNHTNRILTSRQDTFPFPLHPQEHFSSPTRAFRHSATWCVSVQTDPPVPSVRKPR